MNATDQGVIDRLAIFYDGPGSMNTGHLQRVIELAWLKLPLPLKLKFTPSQ